MTPKATYIRSARNATQSTKPLQGGTSKKIKSDEVVGSVGRGFQDTEMSMKSANEGWGVTSVEDEADTAQGEKIDIEISIGEDDLTGQFTKLAEELDLSEMEESILEHAIREFVEMKNEEYGFEMGEEMQEATANVIVSTLRQEYKELNN
jgi:hypothetical protein